MEGFTFAGRVDIYEGGCSGNTAVMLSGLAVMMMGIRYFDLIVVALIGLYAFKEAFEILKEARNAKASVARRDLLEN